MLPQRFHQASARVAVVAGDDRGELRGNVRGRPVRVVELAPAHRRDALEQRTRLRGV